MDFYEKIEDLKNSGKTVEFVLGTGGATHTVKGTVISVEEFEPIIQVQGEDGKTHTLFAQHLLDIIED